MPAGARITPPLPLWERVGVRGQPPAGGKRLMSALPGVIPLIPKPSPTRGEGAYLTAAWTAAAAMAAEHDADLPHHAPNPSP
jgi:hypothetical protein